MTENPQFNVEDEQNTWLENAKHLNRRAHDFASVTFGGVSLNYKQYDEAVDMTAPLRYIIIVLQKELYRQSLTPLERAFYQKVLEIYLEANSVLFKAFEWDRKILLEKYRFASEKYEHFVDETV